MAETLGGLLWGLVSASEYGGRWEVRVGGHAVYRGAEAIALEVAAALRAAGDAIEGRVLRLIASALAGRLAPDPAAPALAADCAADPLDPAALGLLADWLEDRRFPEEDVGRVRSLALRSGDLLVLTPGQTLSQASRQASRDHMEAFLKGLEERHGVRCEGIVLPEPGWRLDLLRVARGGASGAPADPRPEYDPVTGELMGGMTEPCCRCGEEYPRADLIVRGEVFCERCRTQKGDA